MAPAKAACIMWRRFMAGLLIEGRPKDATAAAARRLRAR
jgi:hypothetical protein